MAAPIAHWTFEASAPSATDTASIAIISPELGSGTASGVHASAGTDWSNPAGNGSNESWSANNWAVGDYFQFQFSTAGYGDIQFSFDQTSSGTGPKDFTFQYSTNGSSFTDLASYSVLQNGGVHPAWSASLTQSAYHYAFDLSALSLVENAAAVYVRLTDASTMSVVGGTVAGGGTTRIDNVLVTATPLAVDVGQSVPDAGVGVAGLSCTLAVLALAARRRRTVRC